MSVYASQFGPAYKALLDGATSSATPGTLVLRDGSGGASLANVYTQTQVDDLISGVSGDLENVYTKDETDSLLGGKSNTGHTHDDRYYTETEINSAVSDLTASINLKAPLVSPSLTGTPTAPTAAGGSSSSQIATCAFVFGEFVNNLASYLPLDGTSPMAGDLDLNAYAINNVAQINGSSAWFPDTVSVNQLGSTTSTISVIAALNLNGNDLLNVGGVTTAGDGTIGTNLYVGSEITTQSLRFSGAGFDGSIYANSGTIKFDLDAGGVEISGDGGLSVGADITVTGILNIGSTLNHDGGGLGLFGVAPVSRQSATTDIKDALTSYGLLQGTSASPLNLDGGALTAGTGTLSGGSLTLSNGTANRIYYGTTGVAAPGSNSAGQKIQLYGTAGTTASSDYAIGIESGFLWNSSGGGYKWYGNGANLLASLSSAGAMNVATNLNVGVTGGAGWNFSTSGGVTYFDGDLTQVSLSNSGYVKFGNATSSSLRFETNATGIGFFGVTPAARGSSTADIKDVLTAYGLLQGTSATPLNLDGGALTAGTSSFAGWVTAQRNGLATTPGDAFISENATAATSLATVQMSPRIRLRGNAWKSSATAASQTQDASIDLLPIAGSASTLSTLRFGFSNNGGAYSYPLTLSSDGKLTMTDVNLYRASADTWQTDDGLIVTGSLVTQSSLEVASTATFLGSVAAMSATVFTAYIDVWGGGPSDGQLTLGDTSYFNNGTQIRIDDTTGQIDLYAGNVSTAFMNIWDTLTVAYVSCSGDAYVTGQFQASGNANFYGDVTLNQTTYVNGLLYGLSAEFSDYVTTHADLYAERGIKIIEQAVQPNSIASGSEVNIYMKSDKLVIQYNHSGTAKYRYLDLTSTDATWTYTTSAP